MKFVIEKPVKPHSPGYAVEVKLMLGDADFYESFELAGFRKEQDEHVLEELVTLLQRLRETKGADRYKDVPGFLSWFGGERVESEAEYEVYNSSVPYEEFRRSYELMDEHCDRTRFYPDWSYYYDHLAQLDDFQVYYYDEAGRKHRVTYS